MQHGYSMQYVNYHCRENLAYILDDRLVIHNALKILAFHIAMNITYSCDLKIMPLYPPHIATEG